MYIKRETALNAIMEHPSNIAPFTKKAVDAIKNILPADVVEVVRCKDCIYYKANSCFNRQWDFESSTEIPLVRENDFCSYGERREECKPKK